jgi:hypothetical protein
MVMRRGRALLQFMKPFGVILMSGTGRENGANRALLVFWATIHLILRKLGGETKAISTPWLTKG